TRVHARRQILIGPLVTPTGLASQAEKVLNRRGCEFSSTNRRNFATFDDSAAAVFGGRLDASLSDLFLSSVPLHCERRGATNASRKRSEPNHSGLHSSSR